MPKEEQEEDPDCIVCMDKPKSMIFDPCGHLLVCKACCDLILSRGYPCPNCRAKIQSAFSAEF
jgi:hypothetical protein